jgi:hypothetical protein
MSHARSEYDDFKALAADAYDAVVAPWAVPRRKPASTSNCSNRLSCAPRRSTAAPFACNIISLQSESLGISIDKRGLVVGWREAPQFPARERAVLAWSEALTRLDDGVSDEVFA